MWLLAFIILFALMILATVIDTAFYQLKERFRKRKHGPDQNLLGKFSLSDDVFKNYGHKPISMSEMLGGKKPGESFFAETADELLIIERMGVYRKGKKVIISDTDEVEPIYDLI